MDGFLTPTKEEPTLNTTSPPLAVPEEERIVYDVRTPPNSPMDLFDSLCTQESTHSSISDCETDYSVDQEELVTADMFESFVEEVVHTNIINAKKRKVKEEEDAFFEAARKRIAYTKSIREASEKSARRSTEYYSDCSVDSWTDAFHTKKVKEELQARREAYLLRYPKEMK